MDWRAERTGRRTDGRADGRRDERPSAGRGRQADGRAGGQVNRLIAPIPLRLWLRQRSPSGFDVDVSTYLAHHLRPAAPKAPLQRSFSHAWLNFRSTTTTAATLASCCRRRPGSEPGVERPGGMLFLWSLLCWTPCCVYTRPPTLWCMPHATTFLTSDASRVFRRRIWIVLPVGRWVDLMVDWSIGLSVCRSIGWSVSRSVGLAVGLTVGRSVWRSVVLLVYQSIGRSAWRTIERSVSLSMGRTVDGMVYRSADGPRIARSVRVSIFTVSHRTVIL